ncbi:hypothetical protein AYI70_g9767 [Smittium culicis]|uniref:Uncharacterized protein n=1 Tax=Smittium culicis TaxID=133412 RepID=A0A1R1X9R6_9FUNG|nr:hypothetical protein AYI70_g11504 [Smittium culicis]OMJ11365.1 hypothetical protein AYI70_g9767 [Smittium culicis]
MSKKTKFAIYCAFILLLSRVDGFKNFENGSNDLLYAITDENVPMAQYIEILQNPDSEGAFGSSSEQTGGSGAENSSSGNIHKLKDEDIVPGALKNDVSGPNHASADPDHPKQPPSSVAGSGSDMNIIGPGDLAKSNPNGNPINGSENLSIAPDSSAFNINSAAVTNVLPGAQDSKNTIPVIGNKDVLDDPNSSPAEPTPAPINPNSPPMQAPITGLNEVNPPSVEATPAPINTNPPSVNSPIRGLPEANPAPSQANPAPINPDSPPPGVHKANLAEPSTALANASPVPVSSEALIRNNKLRNEFIKNVNTEDRVDKNEIKNEILESGRYPPFDPNDKNNFYTKNLIEKNRFDICFEGHCSGVKPCVQQCIDKNKTEVCLKHMHKYAEICNKVAACRKNCGLLNFKGFMSSEVNKPNNRSNLAIKNTLKSSLTYKKRRRSGKSRKQRKNRNARKQRKRCRRDRIGLLVKDLFPSYKRYKRKKSLKKIADSLDLSSGDIGGILESISPKKRLSKSYSISPIGKVKINIEIDGDERKSDLL